VATPLAAQDVERAIYDGRTYLGRIVERDRAWLASDAADNQLGAFLSVGAAMAAVRASQGRAA